MKLGEKTEDEGEEEDEVRRPVDEGSGSGKKSEDRLDKLKAARRSFVTESKKEQVIFSGSDRIISASSTRTRSNSFDFF
jgi:hypothetical protein